MVHVMTRLQEMKLIAEGSERDRLELQKQLDAQRLRADTAEAELKREKEFHAVSVSESERMLAAAEQRIAELWTLLREGLEEQKNGDDWIDRVVAALNPNPEAESHE